MRVLTSLKMVWQWTMQALTNAPRFAPAVVAPGLLGAMAVLIAARMVAPYSRKDFVSVALPQQSAFPAFAQE